MHVELNLPQVQKKWHGSYRAYSIGFFLCFSLTCLSFGLVLADAPHALIAVALLAPIQATLQLIFFLHIEHDEKPRWGLLVFFSLLLVLLIIVGGSLWIMFDLNARTMSGMIMQ